MWKPSAIRPYMEPSASPLMMAEVKRMAALPSMAPVSAAAAALALQQARLGLLRQRQDLTLNEGRKDVVLFREGILVRGAEGLLVGLDQARVGVDGIEGLAHLRPLEAAGLGDRQPGEV